MEASSSASTSAVGSSVLNDDPMDVDAAIDSEEIPRIAIEGFDDDDEETLTMTVEEAKDYILSRVMEYMKDPKVNPLLVLENQIRDQHKKIQQKNEEFNKLSKVFEVLYRDQVKFLRHIGVMSKADTKTVGVSVDLPWTPESMGNLDIKQDNKSLVNQVAAASTSEPPAKISKKESSGPVECIDLSSDEDTPDTKSETKVPSTNKSMMASATATKAAAIPSTSITILPKVQEQFKHPAPLPNAPVYLGKPTDIPPKPLLKISVETKGIVLQWDMPAFYNSNLYRKIKNFEIFGYQEKPDVAPSTSLWKKIGTVEYMNLPMSCTLTQFVEGFKYHFSIRAIAPPDISGAFSDAATITFKC